MADSAKQRRKDTFDRLRFRIRCAKSVAQVWSEQPDDHQDQEFFELLLHHLNEAADEANKVEQSLPHERATG